MAKEIAVKEIAHEFILHVIQPPMRLNWATPRGLFLTTFFNHVRKDKAPIGHLFVEFTVPKNSDLTFPPQVASVIQSGSRVITGMSREKMTVVESIKVVQGKRLGLGTFYHDFKGKLDSIQEARDEIEWAKKKNRYASIRVPMSEERAKVMMTFLKSWIERGSFRHYSGGLRVDLGEGAGCAEFGMQMLSLALGVRSTHPEWMRRVRVPSFLIGGGYDPNDNPYKPKRVTLWSILLKGFRWAFSNEEHRVYSIPDPELIFDWVQKKTAGKQDHSLVLNLPEVTWHSGECQLTPFQVTYEVEPAGSIQEQWAKIIG